MSDKELDELIKLAQEGLEDVKPSKREPITEAHMFIRDLGLKRSDTKIPNIFIYQRYLEWREEQGIRKPPMAKSRFFRIFKKRFRSARDGEYRYYFVTPDPFDLSRKKFFEICRQLDKEKAARLLRKKYEKIVQQYAKEPEWENPERKLPVNVKLNDVKK